MWDNISGGDMCFFWKKNVIFLLVCMFYQFLVTVKGTICINCVQDAIIRNDGYCGYMTVMSANW